ncbi:MAG: hypothetical protein ACYTG7_23130 [Planctomycetota bacterium]
MRVIGPTVVDNRPLLPDPESWGLFKRACSARGMLVDNLSWSRTGRTTYITFEIIAIRGEHLERSFSSVRREIQTLMRDELEWVEIEDN